MTEKFICIIPARYKSSRFKGKSVFPIADKPMITWVIEHATNASLVSEMIVATDDDRIENVAKDTKCKVVRTSPDCPNGSARVAEVANEIEAEWVFEMQGDQPLVTPDIIDDFLARAKAMVEKDPSIDVVIPYAPATKAHTDSLDVLKVVKTESDRLVFQTRQPIQTGWRTLGLYLWKKKSLLRFADLPVSDIEKTEDSHPIRLYVNDFHVQGLLIDTSNWVEVDREHQVAEVEKIMKERGLV